jgi:hypothetical protein
MISRNLSRRLERLEALVISTGPPHVIQIVFVSPNGEEELGPAIEIQTAPSWREGPVQPAQKACISADNAEDF